MEKRKLSAIPRDPASEDMLEIAEGLGGLKYIITARLIEDNKILFLNFYEIRTLKDRNTEAVFRTFLSNDDYITQDLTVSKIKWKTASFNMMSGFQLFKSHWNSEKNRYDRTEQVFIRSDQESQIMKDFFKAYALPGDEYAPWSAIHRFQEEVIKRRLKEKYKKETDPIDALMDTVKPAPKEFEQWVFDEALSFSRYLIYQEISKGKAKCECTHCGKTGSVNRNEVRLRNNEKGSCPFCGSKVTIKAKGKLPYRITDKRYVVYIAPRPEGFIWRYFSAYREIHQQPEATMELKRVSQGMYECARSFYTFSGEKPTADSYEYTVFRQSGITRWCHSEGKIVCDMCILYPENLPQAWHHTPMKYSALEILSKNMPTTSLHYEWGIKRTMEFPALEWLCKMGLNQLASYVIDGQLNYQNRLNLKGRTIYDILQINKVNTRLLQVVDGNSDVLRLIQVSEKIGLNFKADQLKGYYETFECNTELLKQANRKVSLHKLVRYIEKESERYPLGKKGGCWQYSYMQYKEREDPRIERKQNMAKDWLEYLDWCKALKYDLDNMFIYMPNNFKKVHDRTAKEYQALQDQKAADKKKRQEALAKEMMKQTQKAMEELFKKNEGTDAFSIKGNGLVLVVPKSGAEIKEEGEKLHHCVGGYVERVAGGETNIFFIRKTEAPDVPYFTLEFRDNKVFQCRGYRNCGMPPEVKAFVKVFEKKMQEAVKKQTTEKKRQRTAS